MKKLLYRSHDRIHGRRSRRSRGRARHDRHNRRADRRCARVWSCRGTVTVTGPQLKDHRHQRRTVHRSVLDSGIVPVHAELQGFTVNRADVQVRLGQTVELPLTLAGRRSYRNRCKWSQRAED